MKPLEYKTQHHPTTSNTLYRTPYLNNKQNKNTNKIISRQDYHVTQPCPSEETQTNEKTNNKNSAPMSSCRKLTQATGPTLGGEKPKGRKNSTFFKERILLSLSLGKEHPKHNKFLKIKIKGRGILHKQRNKLETQKFK